MIKLSESDYEDILALIHNALEMLDEDDYELEEILLQIKRILLWYWVVP